MYPINMKCSIYTFVYSFSLCMLSFNFIESFHSRNLDSTFSILYMKANWIICQHYVHVINYIFYNIIHIEIKIKMKS
jgi:hypothetical protein